MSKNEIAIKESEVQIFNPSLPVTQDMLNDMKTQRSLLKDFVSSQLRKDTDYGVVPGTDKPSLFKPGAEKLRGLFGLNVKLECTSQQLDRKDNFAMYTYKAQIYRGDNLIAECEGSTNSQEKKYKERSVWINKVKTKEATPVCDILNTLQKMAQKRAFVGAIILAVGASDFFTQDIDDPTDATTLGTIPNEVKTVSSIPNVVNVSSRPVSNNQSSAEVLVEALVEYPGTAAKSAGFSWDKVSKKWTKKITYQEMQSFPFEVEELK